MLYSPIMRTPNTFRPTHPRSTALALGLILSGCTAEHTAQDAAAKAPHSTICDYPNNSDLERTCLRTYVDKQEERRHRDESIMEDVSKLRTAARFLLGNTLVFVRCRTPLEAKFHFPALIPFGTGTLVREPNSPEPLIETNRHVIETESQLYVGIPEYNPAENLLTINLTSNPATLPRIQAAAFISSPTDDLALARLSSIEGRDLLPYTHTPYTQGLIAAKADGYYGERLHHPDRIMGPNSVSYRMGDASIAFPHANGTQITGDRNSLGDSGMPSVRIYLTNSGSIAVDKVGTVAQRRQEPNISGLKIIPQSTFTAAWQQLSPTLLSIPPAAAHLTAHPSDHCK